MSIVSKLKSAISSLSSDDQNLLLKTALRLGGKPEAESEDVSEPVSRPKAKKNNKAEEKRKPGRPKKEEKPAKTSAKEKPAKAGAKPAASGEFEFSSSVKKADRAGVIAKIQKIMDNDSITADDLKAKYEKKGVEINFGRGRKADPAKKKIILVAAANAGQKI